MSSTKKVMFIGNAKTRKTSIARMLLSTNYDKYIPTLGVEVSVYRGVSGITYNLWDCAGQHRYCGLREGYYVKANIIILFTSDEEYYNKTKYGFTSPQDYIAMVNNVAPQAIIYHVHNATLDQIKHILV